LGVTKDQNEVIDLTNNDIARLENFPFMSRLSTLLISNNRICKIDSDLAQFLPNLESLIMADNDLRDFVALQGLVSLKKLKFLVLSGNPVSQYTNYRLFCIHTLPQVKYLDYSHVKQTEREEAKKLFETEHGKKMLSNTFNIGELGQNHKKAMDPESIERIKTAIRNAKTLEEVTILERQLRQGRF
jgi:U2 small nuclear ribonucleoprotein A'